MARRPPVTKPEPSPKRTPLQLQRMPQRGSAVLASARRVISNGMVVAADKNSPGAGTDGDEESVMAIQKFLDSANAEEREGDVKVPSGVKITAAGRGVVNIRAVADTAKTPTTSRGRGRPPVNRAIAATTTTNAATRRPPGRPPGSTNKSPSPRKMVAVEDEVNFDETDSDADEEALRELTEVFEQEEKETKAAEAAAAAGKVNGNNKAAKKTGTTTPLVAVAEGAAKVIKAEVEDSPWDPPTQTVREAGGTPAAGSSKRTTSESETPNSGGRSKRQRKETKIFDL